MDKEAQNEIGMQSVLSRAEIPGSKIDDEMVFFNQETGKYFGTGIVGTEIWEQLHEPKKMGEICEALLNKFDIDKTTCEAQVESFVLDLLKEGIIRTEI